MYGTLNSKDFDFLSEDDKDLLNRISAYSARVIGEVEPGEVRISQQLEVLKPVMQEIADEKKIPLEDIFIKYMDLASLVLARTLTSFEPNSVQRKRRKNPEEKVPLGRTASRGKSPLLGCPKCPASIYFTTLTRNTPLID